WLFIKRAQEFLSRSCRSRDESTPPPPKYHLSVESLTWQFPAVIGAASRLCRKIAHPGGTSGRDGLNLQGKSREVETLAIPLFDQPGWRSSDTLGRSKRPGVCHAKCHHTQKQRIRWGQSLGGTMLEA